MILPEVDAQLLAPVLIKVGEVSTDQTVIVGRDGWLFLYKGTNDVASLYAMSGKDERVLGTAKRWEEIVSARIDAMHSRGIAFQQIIIPEKSTVLNQFAPPSFSTKTAIYSEVDRRLSPQSAIYDSSLPILLEPFSGRLVSFPKTGTHLTVAGTARLVFQLLRALELKFRDLRTEISNLRKIITDSQPSMAPRLVQGDISGRFGVSFCEMLVDLDTSPIAKFGLSINQIVNAPAPNNGHVGSKACWVNPHAPIPIKVVCFGNSFFERGSNPNGLSWWSKHLFREFHFVWSPFLDFEYVDRHSPQLVICQTIERFLMLLPRS